MTRVLVPTYKCDKCGNTKPEVEFGRIPVGWYQTSIPRFIGYMHVCSLECLEALIRPAAPMDQV